MIRSQIRVFGVLALTFATLMLSASTVFASDILEFIDIPIDEHQASVEPILACQNGFMFGFHSIDEVAVQDGAPTQWDISFARADGSLIIEEYPLWMGETETPLVRDDITFDHANYFTLLWQETVPVTPLTTCYSGAGSGFCNTTIDIAECTIDPGLVASIARTGPQNTTRTVTDTLVYEVRAYDPAVGTRNGDGIAEVTMHVIDRVSGTAVYTNVLSTPSQPEGGVQYCAFSPDCEPWVFSEHNFTWPSGEPVENGTYLLRATVNTPENARKVVQTPIEVGTPPHMTTVRVPAGDFPMGSDSDTRAENPVHTVPVDDFWIMKTEVTNKQYAQCVADDVCTPPENAERLTDPAYADHPVAGVDWEQANTFAAWAGGRLPTEAEWEKACRSADGRTYPWGNESPTYDLANYDNEIGDTTPVGSYPDNASPYGALDMGGNVWEWTSSLYRDYPYQADDGRENPDAEGRRVARGGSFYYTHYQLTCSFRAPMDPEEVNAQIGLRVVFDQPMNEAGIRFVTPANGAIVPPTFDVEMGASGITIEPAGEIHENAGHFHIIVDSAFVAPGELVPFDENHLHFGQGQLTTTLDLEPGIHSLKLQVANGAHIAMPGEQYRDEITVVVQSNSDTNSGANSDTNSGANSSTNPEPGSPTELDSDIEWESESNSEESDSEESDSESNSGY